jgi:putative intracellular protease/amidase
MRALIVSADRFEDSELSEPVQQLRARGVDVDIAAPQQGPITGKYTQGEPQLRTPRLPLSRHSARSLPSQEKGG